MLWMNWVFLKSQSLRKKELGNCNKGTEEGLGKARIHMLRSCRCSSKGGSNNSSVEVQA